MSQFVFVVCQNGAEGACRDEVQRMSPKLKPAFSRPGFLTFKVPPGSLPSRFYLRSTLARTFGWSATSLREPVEAELPALAEGVSAAMLERLAEWLLAQASDDGQVPPIHIWERDAAPPGHRGFEPGPTEWVAELAATLQSTLAAEGKVQPLKINRNAVPDEKVLDIVRVDPGQWWLGWHFATTPQQRWPGGVPPIDRERKVISRAYFKLHEALLWSGIRIQPGEVCAEIGSAPGGACQRLLEFGANVIAIDPAELDSTLTQHPNLLHLQRRGREVRKRDLAPARWLMADLNVTPHETINMIAELVEKGHLKNVRGMLLTLKLNDWDWIDRVPDLIEFFRQLGFQVIKTRQLAFNRNEFCLLAARDQFALRVSKKKKKKNKTSRKKKSQGNRDGGKRKPRKPRE